MILGFQKLAKIKTTKKINQSMGNHQNQLNSLLFEGSNNNNNNTRLPEGLGTRKSSNDDEALAPTAKETPTLMLWGKKPSGVVSKAVGNLTSSAR